MPALSATHSYDAFIIQPVIIQTCYKMFHMAWDMNRFFGTHMAMEYVHEAWRAFW